MKDRPPNAKTKAKPRVSQQVNEVQLESSGKVVVEHQAIPAPAPAELKIHARRPLPPVPDRGARPTKSAQEKDD
jgi:hypothetical protein